MRVTIEGIRGEIRTNVRRTLGMARLSANDSLTEARVQRLHERAESEIRLALQPFGHYRPHVETSLEHDGRFWRARYLVDPGEPVRLVAVDVLIEGEGADDESLNRVFERSRVRSGMALRHPAYESAKQRLQNQAAARGYLDAVFTRSRVEVDTVANEARVSVRLETGPRYRFGEVHFPETPFDSRVLERYVAFSDGDPFLLGELVMMQRLLSANEIFTSVEVEPLPTKAVDLRVPIQVRLRLQPRTRYGFGIGYGTDTGPRGTVAWGRRWLNPAAHGLWAEVQASSPVQSAVVQYALPLGKEHGDEASAMLAIRRERFENLEARSLTAGITAAYSRGSWRESPSFRVLREQWFVAGQEKRSTLVLPSLTYTRVRADDPTYPRRGSRVEFGLLGTTTLLGSDIGFVQATTRLRLQQGLHRSGRLLLRLDGGGTGLADVADLPLSFRLFAGGSRSVRGYNYRSLAPRAADGTLLGGRNLLAASVELEQMVVAGMGFALFTDAGGAFTRADDDWLRHGAGAGLRWRSPVGPVRLDAAWPLDGSRTGPRLYFMLGGTL